MPMCGETSTPQAHEQAASFDCSRNWCMAGNFAFADAFKGTSPGSVTFKGPTRIGLAARHAMVPVAGRGSEGVAQRLGSIHTGLREDSEW